MKNGQECIYMKEQKKPENITNLCFTERVLRSSWSKKEPKSLAIQSIYTLQNGASAPRIQTHDHCAQRWGTHRLARAHKEHHLSVNLDVLQQKLLNF